MKIGIVGTGLFSVSVAIRLAEVQGNLIELWSENKDLVKDFKKTKKLNTIFKGKDIPIGITVSNSIEDVLKEKDIVFLMSSIPYFSSSVDLIKDLISKEIPVVIGTKGVNKMGLFPYQIAKKSLKNPLLIMSGPTFAQDMCSHKLLGFTLAGTHKKSKVLVKKAFLDSEVVIEESVDLLGTSLVGVLKNVYAIGSGLLKETMGLESTKAFYITAVYHEIYDLLYRFYGKEETLFSLSCLGDLILSCNSEESRNFSYGALLGKKSTKKEINEFKKKNTIEGVESLEYLMPLINKKRAKAPLLRSIYEIVNQNQQVEDFITILKNSIH